MAFRVLVAWGQGMAGVVVKSRAERVNALRFKRRRKGEEGKPPELRAKRKGKGKREKLEDELQDRRKKFSSCELQIATV